MPPLNIKEMCDRFDAFNHEVKDLDRKRNLTAAEDLAKLITHGAGTLKTLRKQDAPVDNMTEPKKSTKTKKGRKHRPSKTNSDAKSDAV